MNLVSYLWFPVQGNMRHWIEDSDCRDQYSVIYEAGERTAIFSNDAKDPILAEERAVSYPTTSCKVEIIRMWNMQKP